MMKSCLFQRAIGVFLRGVPAVIALALWSCDPAKNPAGADPSNPFDTGGNNETNPDGVGDGDGDGGDGTTTTEDRNVTLVECASDAIDLNQYALCPCTFRDGCDPADPNNTECCDLKWLDCVCQEECLVPGTAGCPQIDTFTRPDGTIGFSPIGNWIGGIAQCGDQSCSDPDDTTASTMCSFSECELQDEVIMVDPQIIEPQQVVNPVAPAVQIDVAVEVEASKVLTTIDPSVSMSNNQANLACTVSDFKDVVENGGGGFEMAVAPMNVHMSEATANPAQDTLNNGALNVPVVSSGNCSSTPICSNCEDGGQNAVGACSVNDFDMNGGMTGDIEELQRRFVLGGYGQNPNGDSLDEVCLEYAAQYLCQHGCDALSQVICVSDEDGDGDGDLCTYRRSIDTGALAAPACADPSISLNSGSDASVADAGNRVWSRMVVKRPQVDSSRPRPHSRSLTKLVSDGSCSYALG